MMKHIVQNFLVYCARRTIRRYRPLVIGVTGSVGKTSSKEAMYTVLKGKYRVRRSEKSFNTEIGIPLTILNAHNHYRNIAGWVGECIDILRKMIFGFEYPEILILEYGVQKPGDMDYLLSVVKPHIGVVTAIGDIPVHVEFFRGPEELIREKEKLVAALPPDGYAILFHDDFAVYGMREKTRAHVMTYGSEAHADVCVTNYKLQTIQEGESGDVPSGISFKIMHGGHMVPFRLYGALGVAQAYAAAAAATTGLALNLNLIEITEAMHNYQSPAGRLRLLKGIKNSFILDDTYNAAPESMRIALETLKELPARRKIVVLGDMLEIGKYAEQVHRRMGDIAAEFVDFLVTVGPRAKFIADEAMIRGVENDARRLSRDCVLQFDDAVAAGKALDPLVKEGDLILIKGSQSMRMEKVVEEIMAHPERAEELLVRQDAYWRNA